MLLFCLCIFLVCVDFSFSHSFRPLMFCLNIMFVFRDVCQISVVNCIDIMYFLAVFVFYFVLCVICL